MPSPPAFQVTCAAASKHDPSNLQHDLPAVCKVPESLASLGTELPLQGCLRAFPEVSHSGDAQPCEAV